MRALRIFLGVLFVLSFASSLSAQSTPATHPLDALKTQEYWTVYDVLHSSGKMDPETSVHSVLLREPAKDKVLAWKTGDPIAREAEVILLNHGVTIEALVDIAAGRLESWKERKDVHAPLIEAEFRETGEALKKDPQVIEALKKRGYTDLTAIQCFGEPFGYFALPELEGHRIFFGECIDTHGVYLGWSRTIEGLLFEIDATDKKILKVIYDGPVPVTHAPVNYQDLDTEAFPGTTPISLSQPLGPSFHIKGGEVSWQN